MGNWSCLYHWFECRDADAAEHLLARMAGAAAFDWADDARWGLRYGRLAPTVVQAVTSEKWGLTSDFRQFANAGDDAVAVVQAGIDHREFYLVEGCPDLVCLEFDLVVPVSHRDYPLGELGLEGSPDRFAGREALRLARPVALPAPFDPRPMITDSPARAAST